MKGRRTRVALLALAALLLAGGVALAQASTGYDLSWHVIAGGGGRSTSGQYTLQGTAGQAAVGWSTSGTYRLSGGFWLPQTVAEPERGRLYLPLVLRNS